MSLDPGPEGEFEPVPQPRPWGTNRRRLLREGAPLTPLKRLESFSPEDFENFVNEWVHGFLSPRYQSVEMRRGAGDKGRDIIGWLDPRGAVPRRWDNYQCKHYGDRLAPSDIWPEVGKLIYHLTGGTLSTPRRYYFVTALGVGPKLADFLADPATMRAELCARWATSCQDNITSKESVRLEGAIADCVDALDFSIFDSVSPSTLIEQHGKTRYHRLVFGLGLETRPRPAVTPPEVAAVETRYVEQFLEAASEEAGTRLAAVTDLKAHAPIAKVFRQARESFYDVEQLKEFARDSAPDDDDFEELKDDVCDGVLPTVEGSHPNGYQRILKTSQAAVQIQLDRSVLREVLSSKHKVGVVHHLANEDRIIWVRRSDEEE